MGEIWDFIVVVGLIGFLIGLLLLSLYAPVAYGAWVEPYEKREKKRLAAIEARLKERGYQGQYRFKWSNFSQNSEWETGKFFVDDDYLHIHSNRDPEDYEALVSIHRSQIRGYWKEVTTSRIDSLWMHIHQGMSWYILKIPHDKELIKALAKIASHEQQHSYQHDTYDEVKTLEVYPAEQDYETGAWVLDESLTVYLSPLYLFVLDEHDYIQSSIAVRDIEGIERRMHSSKLGVLRFTVNGDEITFAVPQGDSVADRLTEIGALARLTEAFDSDDSATVWKKKKMEQK